MNTQSRQFPRKLPLAALAVLAPYAPAHTTDLFIAMPNWPPGRAAVNVIKTNQVRLDAAGKKTSCLVDADSALKSVEPV